MYYFAAVQQTSAAELVAFFQKFEKAVHALRVNIAQFIKIDLKKSGNSSMKEGMLMRQL